jgi:two-component system, OmpR family, KDP operon response regulator KdpE
VKILLVSEDAGIKNLLQSVFQEYGHDVVLGEQTITPWRLIRGDVDILLYDLGEASPDRWEKLSQWRRIADLPLITMGLAAQEEHAIRALRLGSDDYVTRPLHIAELVARMEALIRRNRMSGWLEAAHPGGHRGVTLDWRSRQLRIEGRRIDLTPTEFKVLQLLVERKGQAVSREELVKEVWGKDRTKADINLSLYIWHLRRKIEENPARPQWITTRWGLGYSFATPEQVVETEEL